MVTSDRDVGIDLSPFIITEIEVDGERLIAQEPLRYTVTYDAEAEVFECEGPLIVLWFAETRELLLDILTEDLEIMWRDFAVGDQSLLDGSAQRVGAQMRDMFTQAADAA